MRRLPVVTPARLVLLVALVVWILSLRAIGDASVNAYGLLFAGVPGLVIAAVLTVVGLALAVRRNSAVDSAAAVVVFIVISRLTGVITLAVPGSTFVYRHLGVIDFIRQNGALSPGTDIYNAWPGAFATVAWFSDVTGISPTAIATAFPFVCDLVFAAAVFLLCRALGQRAVVALTGAFVASIVNWVGQDYLSPQAIGIILATLILTLLVEGRKHPAAAWLSIPLFVALTITHQLTPYWIVGVAIVLGITGHIRPRYLGLIFLVIAVIDLLFNLNQVTGQGLLSNLNPLSNAQTIPNGSDSTGHIFTAFAAKIPSAALWIAAAVCGILVLGRKRFRGTQQVWIPAVFAFSSFALLFQNYGGEAIFRVFLYSIPGSAALVAPFLTRLLQRRSRTRLRIPFTAIATTVVTIVVLLASMQAYFGGWFANVVRADSVAAVTTWLDTTAAPAALLTPTVGAPLRPDANYAKFAASDAHYDASLDTWTGWRGSTFTTTDRVDEFSSGIAYQNIPTYVLITKQNEIYSDYYGVYPKGSLERLITQLSHRADWKTITSTPTLHLFEYTGTSK